MTVGAGERPLALAVAVLDGVHAGHRALLTELRAVAREVGAAPRVAMVERPAAGPGALVTTVDRRLALLHGAGVEDVLRVPLGDGPLPGTAAALVRALRPRAVVVGGGDDVEAAAVADAVRAVGAELRIVPAPTVPGAGEVTTARLRHAIRSGDMALAAALLGRVPEVVGVVEHGDARGRTIGFPTANVAVPDELLLPAEGVYAGTYTRPDGSVHVSAISIGRRETFYAERGLLLVEAYLLDFDGDLYGEHATVAIERWLRGQERFPSVEALVDQLHRDVASTRRHAAGR